MTSQPLKMMKTFRKHLSEADSNELMLYRHQTEADFKVGDRVRILDGDHEGQRGKIWKIEKSKFDRFGKSIHVRFDHTNTHYGSAKVVGTTVNPRHVAVI